MMHNEDPQIIDATIKFWSPWRPGARVFVRHRFIMTLKMAIRRSAMTSTVTWHYLFGNMPVKLCEGPGVENACTGHDTLCAG